MKFIRASVNDVELLWQMQVESFKALLDKYKDYDTSPANESMELIRRRLEQPFTYFYFIEVEGIKVGAVRIVDHKDERPKRISPLFILPVEQNKGYAQQAMIEAERLHGVECWELNTILEETGNCYLYEKMGYRKTGELKVINDKLTLITYTK